MNQQIFDWRLWIFDQGTVAPGLAHASGRQNVEFSMPHEVRTGKEGIKVSVNEDKTALDRISRLKSGYWKNISRVLETLENRKALILRWIFLGHLNSAISTSSERRCFVDLAPNVLNFQLES